MNKDAKRTLIADLVLKLLWQPRGWHQGAMLAGGTPFTASGRRLLRKFRDSTQGELYSVCGGAING